MPVELCENSEFAEKPKDMAQGFTEFELVMRDEVAKKNALRRDIKQTSRQRMLRISV